MVNRVWYHLLGRGIVEPVDDFRDTNPPSNPELLDSLAKDFAKNGYRVKPLIRSILNSNTYQLASTGAPKQLESAADADRYFTKAAVRMLTAEQILDAISAATGVPETFKGYPAGTRAVDLAEGASIIHSCKPSRNRCATCHANVHARKIRHCRRCCICSTTRGC